MTAPVDSLPRVATALGRAGLLPFCAAPLLIYLDPGRSAFYAATLTSYALSIVCFLVGVWWGLALIRRSSVTLLLSNAVVIVAFSGHILLATHLFLLLCALLFAVTVAVEQRSSLFLAQPPYYARLRIQLTAVAIISLILSAALLWETLSLQHALYR